MTSLPTKEDIESFIEAILYCDMPLLPEAEVQPSIQKSQEAPLTSISQVQSSISFSEDQDKKLITPSSEGDIPAQKKPAVKPKPKDYLKNMYNNSLKYIVKRYISKNYETKVQRIHRKLGIVDSEAAKSYYRIRQEQTIGLTNLCDLLNFTSGSEIQKVYKKAFHIFYVWYMRSKYPVHILQTDKLQHADVYWRAKNVLIYLPETKVKARFDKQTNKQQEISLKRDSQ